MLYVFLACCVVLVLFHTLNVDVACYAYGGVISKCEDHFSLEGVPMVCMIWELFETHGLFSFLGSFRGAAVFVLLQSFLLIDDFNSVFVSSVGCYAALGCQRFYGVVLF